MHEDGRQSLSEVCRIKINFSSYEQKIVCGENSQSYDYVGFKVDRKQGVMMLLSKYLENGAKDRLFVKLIMLGDEDDILL